MSRIDQPKTPSLRGPIKAEAIQAFGAETKYCLADARRWIASLALAMAALVAAPALAAWQTPGVPMAQLNSATPPAPGITTTVSEPFYKIMADDVGREVARQLELQAVATHAQASLDAGTPPVLFTADHALQVVIHALQIDPTTKRWQGQAYVMAGGKTEIVKPVAGIYEALIEVPVLKRQLRPGDVIAADDLDVKLMPERQLRKDSITDSKQLIGQSSRNSISPQRPLRMAEISAPIVIKKGDSVEMSYKTPYMSLKATGVALENGSTGQSIRIKNDKSEKAVSARVVSAGHADVSTSL